LLQTNLLILYDYRFAQKFHHIVAQEQGSNFITRLHNGRMDIIAWPVIESKRFYTRFTSLEVTLDQQSVTHPRAGVFLSTLKTLMAKLKVPVKQIFGRACCIFEHVDERLGSIRSSVPFHVLGSCRLINLEWSQKTLHHYALKTLTAYFLQRSPMVWLIMRRRTR